MALITFNDRTPPYLITKGNQNTGGANAAVFYNIASTVIASNKITATTATRITFQESGIYELMVNLYSLIQVPSSMNVRLQTGINGVFTTQKLSANATGFDLSFYGSFKFMLNINNGDYFELRNLISGTPTQHNTLLVNSPVSGSIQVPLTFKRID